MYADPAQLVAGQRNYFLSNNTLPYPFRISQLKKLRQLIEDHESEILQVLHADLKKSSFEAWGTEAGICLTELNECMRYLHHWMEPETVKTPLFHFRSKSYIHSEPFGVTLIIAPWNYPFMLSLRPAIGALAAGNTVLLKPSEMAPATAAFLEKLINENFDARYFHVINADVDGTQVLLKEKFNYIFYTGSTRVGQIIYEAAAKQLTPCALELGGKSPCIVDADVNLDIAAKRIAWGKFVNCGQVCIAPDYILIDHRIRDAFIKKVKENLDDFFGKDASLSPDYGKIINLKNLNRLSSYLKDVNIISGGRINADTLYMEPTLVAVDRLDIPLMQEEIFGPVLPIITYHSIEEAIQMIRRNPDPLALYLFTRNRKLAKRIMREVPAGDMSINENLFHLGHQYLPFGGIGNSGIGKYIGKYSFHKFSHQKGILDKKFFPDLSIRYPPYTAKKLRWLKWLVKKWM